MAVYTIIQLRRDTGANWESSNPVLRIGEVGIDMTRNRMKVGDGINAWKDRPYIDDLFGDMINSLVNLINGGNMKDPVDNKTDLPVKYPSPEVGWTVFVLNEKKFYTWTGSAWEPTPISSGGEATPLVNSLDSTRTDAALTANMGKTLNDKIVQFGSLGMGYTVNERNAYDKPTKITYEDGAVLNFSWSGTQLTQITASTGETMTFNYDGSGRLNGRVVTRA